MLSRRILAISIAAAGALAFVLAASGGWLYDDLPLIVHNRSVHSLGSFPRWFTEDFWHVSEDFVRFEPRIVYWRPFVTASYAIDWQLSGGSPVWFHIANLLWQALASGLAFIVLRRWLGGSAVAAAVAAFVFAVHPTKAESVAWISGRTDILCMVAIFLVCEGIARRLAGKRGGVALEVAGTLFAYMCKEQAIVLPAFAAIEYWVARGRPALDMRVIWQMLRGAAPQLVIATVYLGLRRAFLPIEAAGIQSPLPFGDHVFTVLETMGRFFALTFAPVELSVQQGLVRVENGELVSSMPHVMLGVAGVIGMVAVAVLARKRAPLVTLGIVFYLATLAPTANIVLSHMRTLVSERFLYLPLLGIAIIIGWAYDRYASRSWCRAGAALIAVACFGASLARSADYRDEKTFWARELRLHPDSRAARMVLVNYHVREKRYAAAMLDILKMTDATIGERVEIAFLVAQIATGMAPDLDQTSLAAIDVFADQLLRAAPPSATLDFRELRYTIATGTSTYQAELARFRLRLVALRTDLASRLGDDKRAVALAGEILAECARCAGPANLAALAIARAGDYDRASKALDAIGDLTQTANVRKMIDEARVAHERAFDLQGPAQLQARASEYAALELWGRAYAVLAPHKEQIKRAPKVVMGFAELAFRAGDTAVAREVLAGQVAPAEIDAHLADWSSKMGWR